MSKFEPTTAQLQELFTKIKSGQITKESFEKLLQGQGPNFPSYLVTVDYKLTVEQLVLEGNYNWYNDDITAPHFPLAKKSGKTETDIFIVPNDRPRSTESVIQMLNEHGLRRPNIKEGLSLGAQYPNLQIEGPIAILCEPWRGSDGDLDVPCLYGVGSSRCLRLYWWGGGWDANWRFAAVRK